MRRIVMTLGLCIAAAQPAMAQVSELFPPSWQDSLARLDRSAARRKARQQHLDALAAGRKRWHRAGIVEYQLQTHYAPSGLPAPQGAGKLYPLGVLATVRNGLVADRQGGKPIDELVGPQTIDALFAQVESDVRDRGRVVMRLELDLRYGFPRHYYGDTPGWFDVGTLIDVDSFAVVQPRRDPVLTRADSALVGRILLAEDRRDSADVALVDGSRHADAYIRLLAQRARLRIRDPWAAGRDSLPPPRAPLTWPEAYWKDWYRNLVPPKADCSGVRVRLSDDGSGDVGSTFPWPVQLRAVDLITATCASDDSIAARLRTWIDALPADASRRAKDSVSWHAAAHGLVALARMRPAEARPRLAKLAAHREWHVRAYAARAAEVLSDTLTLRVLARDAYDNVKEAAIVALAKVTQHASDDVYVAALGGAGAPAVRAAATALKGSPRPDVATIASTTFERWVAHQNAAERDVRVALLEAAGRPASDDRPPVARHVLPPRAVSLALGADVRLRVRMSPASGGGSFVVRLRGDQAPMMAARILALSHAKYYDGLDWHRVEADFVIQGGSPGSNEYVGAPQYLRDELGRVHHVRGTVGMSTRGHDSGDAQWFVNLKDNLRLDRDYTVFAEVIDGMEVVDGIIEGDIIMSIEEVSTP